MYARNVEEDRRRQHEREALLAGLRTALEIIDATSGEFSYAYADGYYGDTAYKFSSTEERDAWLAAWREEHDGSDYYRAATREDIASIITGNVMPKSPEA